MSHSSSENVTVLKPGRDISFDATFRMSDEELSGSSARGLGLAALFRFKRTLPSILERNGVTGICADEFEQKLFPAGIDIADSLTWDDLEAASQLEDLFEYEAPARALRETFRSALLREYMRYGGQPSPDARDVPIPHPSGPFPEL